ncbi:MAG: L-seryl-tRNA(Sec) selenium transferase [Gammaproteobacteria bacterium]|nr:MAG: L-seryl-tRNA(Sec) selenium transferase [Gammaproteobacteria bacterium]
MPSASLRDIPGVDALLTSPEILPLIRDWGRLAVRKTIRALQTDLRGAIGTHTNPDLRTGALAREINVRLIERGGRGPRPVFNLTGTIVHSNLGRASLPEVAISAIEQAARHPVDLEYDLHRGGRGQRDTHVGRLLCDLTGAAAATVVNNNAAAVLLILNTLALDQTVPVSRGELIEIGGSFRIPDIMARAGCRLCEIGTTNRTHRQDYARAINDQTALLLKVHPSNYVIDGFTAQVPERELAALAHEWQIPFVVDLGSGALVDLSAYGLPVEPTPMTSLEHGADLVSFSGDKLLGGPQAGIIVGSQALIDRLDANPLKRALRVDKLTLAALAEVLKLYTEPARLAAELPILRQLTRPLDAIEHQAGRLAPRLAHCLRDFSIRVSDMQSQFGSGALPLRAIRSAGLRITPADSNRLQNPLDQLARNLRGLPRPVIGRIRDGSFWLDLRCLEDEQQFVAQLAALSLI